MIGDGKMKSAIDFDLHEMQKIGSNENMNVLAYVTPRDSVVSGSHALVIQKGQIFQDGEIMNKNGDQAQTIIDACAWVHEKFPSDNFVIIFCNHSLELAYFTAQDWPHALSSLVNMRNNKLIDIVAFNAPLMANIEVAYAMQPYVRYLVASEGILPSKGYPYNAALNYAAKWNYAFSSYKMVLDMVNEYETMYQERASGYTFSAIDLTKVWDLRQAMNALVASLILLLDSPGKVAIHQIIQASGNVEECARSGEINYIDLGHFLNNLQANLARAKRIDTLIIKQVTKKIVAAKRALSRCIVDCVYGADFPDSTGLAIYMGCNFYFMHAQKQLAQNH